MTAQGLQKQTHIVADRGHRLLPGSGLGNVKESLDIVVDTHAAIFAPELFTGFQQHDTVLTLLDEAACLLLKALSRHAPCTLEISEQVPDGVGAVYDPAAKKILMRQGMDGADIFRSLTQELAHAYFDKGNYNRNDHAFAGYCVAYTLCKRYGVDTQNFRFDKLPAAMEDMDAKAVRSEVNKVRDCANQISMDMSRVLSWSEWERTAESEPW